MGEGRLPRSMWCWGAAPTFLRCRVLLLKAQRILGPLLLLALVRLYGCMETACTGKGGWGK